MDELQRMIDISQKVIKLKKLNADCLIDKIQ